MAATDTDAMDRLKDLLRKLFRNEEEREAFQSDPSEYLAKYDLTDVEPHEVNECVSEMAPNYEYTPPAPPQHLPKAEQVAYTVQHHHTEVIKEYGDWTYIDQSADTFIDQSVDVEAGDNANIDVETQNTAADDGGIALGEGAEIEDSAVNTGEFEGVQAGVGEFEGDVVTGDDNILDDSTDLDFDVVNVDGAGGPVNVATDGDATQNVDQSQETNTDVDLNFVNDSPGAAVNSGDEGSAEAGIDLEIGAPLGGRRELAGIDPDGDSVEIAEETPAQGAGFDEDPMG